MLFTIYTTSWCGDCVRTKAWLAAHGYQSGTDFVEVNIETEPGAAELIQKANAGLRSVPTLIFNDGTVLTEPSPQELEQKLSS